MTNQIQTASEAKNSNLSSTLAHETRKNKQRLSSFAIVALVLAIGIGLSACGQAGTQTGSSVSNVSRIPDGTYVNGSNNNISWTFSRNKLTVSQYGNVVEFTYFVKDGDFIRYSNRGSNVGRFYLDGGNLILFESFYDHSAHSSGTSGEVYTKQ